MLSEIQGIIIILANVYDPNVDEPTVFGLDKKINDRGDYPATLGGDFNEVMDPILDQSSRLVHVSRAHAALKGMSKVFALVDVWWLQISSGKDYTFFLLPISPSKE